ncbi:MAG TPA: helix-turn-helix domain-containing protein, partial [Rhodocyclaceae bacterium]|nr:helix-turn-helix domain-containing protein [Rhodocyclaceae bacterium]
MISDEELVADNTNALLGVGDRLKAEREARGLSLDDVSQALKISRRVLDQVEANAWGQLPGHTFARGIVRGYAKFVHLDAEPLLLELAKAPLPKPPLLELPQSTRTALPVPGQSQTRDRLAMFAGVVLVAIAVLAYFLVPEDWLSGRNETAVTAEVRVAAPVAPLQEAPAVPVTPPALVAPASTAPAAAGTPLLTAPATVAPAAASPM